MILERLFAPRGPLKAGRALYLSAARQARSAGFYARLGVPDTGEGRFELYSLHVALLVLRLKGQGPAAAEVSQHLFEAYVRALDDALREMGVGDLAVPKRMKKLAEAFYGRMRSFEDALADGGRGALVALLERTVLEGAPPAGADALATYVLAAREQLGRTPLDDLLQGRIAWPRPVEWEGAA